MINFANFFNYWKLSATIFVDKPHITSDWERFINKSKAITCKNKFSFHLRLHPQENCFMFCMQLVKQDYYPTFFLIYTTNLILIKCTFEQECRCKKLTFFWECQIIFEKILITRKSLYLKKNYVSGIWFYAQFKKN